MYLNQWQYTNEHTILWSWKTLP